MSEPLIEPAYHEFDANLIFDEYGLDPFWALESLIREEDGGPVLAEVESPEEDVDETLKIKLFYQPSGIGSLNHPDQRVETIREYRIKWYLDDEIQEKSGSFHIAPRTPEMVDRDGDLIQIGRSLGLVGINVRAQGSNFPFQHYPELLSRAFDALDLNPGYVDPDLIHAKSNIGDLAMYVRIHRDKSGPLTAVDGIINRVANLLAADREGYSKHIADDRKAPGSYHSATIGAERARRLGPEYPKHALPKEIKHYLPRSPDAFDPEEDALAHPKLEVAFAQKLIDERPKFRALEDVAHELEEVLINVIQWAGLPPRAYEYVLEGAEEEVDPEEDRSRDGNPGYFVADQYWKPQESARSDIQLLNDPTPDIRDEQESIVYHFLIEDFTPSAREIAQVLVADGGSLSPEEIADRADLNTQTVRRQTRERLDDVIDRAYGEVKLASTFIAERVSDVLATYREELKGASVAAARALELEGGKYRSAMSELVARYGLEVDDRDDARVALRFNEVFRSRDGLDDALGNLRTVASELGVALDELKFAEVRARIRGQSVVIPQGKRNWRTRAVS